MAKRYNDQQPPIVNKKVNLKVDLSKAKMTLGVLDTLAMFEAGANPSGSDIHELITYFNKVIIGGVRQIPMEDLPVVAAAVMGAMKQDRTAKN